MFQHPIEVLILRDHLFILDYNLLLWGFPNLACFAQCLGFVDLDFTLWILEVTEQVLRDVVFVLNKEDLMKLFVSPGEVLMDLENNDEGDLLQIVISHLLEDSTFFQSSCDQFNVV